MEPTERQLVELNSIIRGIERRTNILGNCEIDSVLREIDLFSLEKVRKILNNISSKPKLKAVK